MQCDQFAFLVFYKSNVSNDYNLVSGCECVCEREKHPLSMICNACEMIQEINHCPVSWHSSVRQEAIPGKMIYQPKWQPLAKQSNIVSFVELVLA